MYRQINDFKKDYQNLIDSTVRIFEKLNDTNIKQPVAAGYRTLGFIAWHIVTTISEMMNRTGLGLSAVNHESSPPVKASVIIDGYKNASVELIKAVTTQWNDKSLEQTDDLYGQKWPRGLTVSALINHEIHHRGQMTVLLRQAGEKIPGVFGPSKEEWAAYGMEAPPY